MAEERTEQATPHRRQKAREDGDRARSRDLLSACAMLAGVLTLGSFAKAWVNTWATSYVQCLALGTGSGWETDALMQSVTSIRRLSVQLLSPVFLLFACVATSALLAGILQGGGLQFQAKALQFKVGRLNPVENVKNLFSMKAFARLGKSVIPAAVLATLAVKKLRQEFEMPAMSFNHLSSMFVKSYDLLMDAAWIYLVWAALDYVIEWRSWERRIRMSKQEMRDEYKESEGSPQIKNRIRGLQRQMRRRKMKADVSKASVVVTNPTHFAVALSFDLDTMDAPKVLAKGRDLLAEQIKKDALWAGVPIVENPPLARSLYRSVEPGQPIPLELYSAVAAILAYLYRRQVEERARQQRAAAKPAAASQREMNTAAGLDTPRTRSRTTEEVIDESKQASRK